MEVHTSHLIVSPNPHIHASDTTRRIIAPVSVAQLPELIASVVLFRHRALLVESVTVACCVLCEYLWCRLRKQTQTAQDFSAVVTGLLLAFNMPVTVPLYLPVIGSVAAIVVTKQLFGGIGHNFANPAIVGRITLAVSFPALMTNYVYPDAVVACDAISSATPLAAKAAEIPLLNLLLATTGGVRVETSTLPLLICLVILVVTRTIDLTIPVLYLATVAVGSALCGYAPLQQLMSGGLMLGAVFMATDYTTSPFTRRGKAVFALGLGVITCLIRFFGNMNEGVSYAILLMNLTVPYINAKTRKVPMGGEKK